MAREVAEKEGNGSTSKCVSEHGSCTEGAYKCGSAREGMELEADSGEEYIYCEKARALKARQERLQEPQ